MRDNGRGFVLLKLKENFDAVKIVLVAFIMSAERRTAGQNPSHRSPVISIESDLHPPINPRSGLDYLSTLLVVPYSIPP